MVSRAAWPFGFEAALGRPLKGNDQWLTVVGVLEGGGGKGIVTSYSEGRRHGLQRAPERPS